MNENYVKVLELCKVIIEQDYVPCNLENEIKKRLLDLVLDWEKRKEKADREGKEIGGLNLLFFDVLRAVNQATGNEKRFGKSKCYYLKRGLQIPSNKRGGFGYWFLTMRE